MNARLQGFYREWLSGFWYGFTNPTVVLGIRGCMAPRSSVNINSVNDTNRGEIQCSRTTPATTALETALR